MAIKAFSLIQVKIPEASMTLVGKDNDKRFDLEKLAQKLGLKNIFFVDRVPKKDIPKLASDHDVYIQTNRVANMPVTIIEMWSLGIPVVATRVGGVPYLVTDKKDGLLVEDENFEQLADICIDLLNNPKLSEQLSLNGRRHAERFTWEHAKPLWENVFFNE